MNNLFLSNTFTVNLVPAPAFLISLIRITKKHSMQMCYENTYFYYDNCMTIFTHIISIYFLTNNVQCCSYV